MKRDSLELKSKIGLKYTVVIPVLVVLLLAAPQTTRTQTVDDAAAQNARKARAALSAMVQALGGQAWLDIKNEMQQGHVAAFFHSQPDLGTTDLWQFHS